MHIFVILCLYVYDTKSNIFLKLFNQVSVVRICKLMINI